MRPHTAELSWPAKASRYHWLLCMVRCASGNAARSKATEEGWLQQPSWKTRLLCMSSTPAGRSGSLPFSSTPR